MCWLVAALLLLLSLPALAQGSKIAAPAPDAITTPPAAAPAAALAKREQAMAAHTADLAKRETDLARALLYLHGSDPQAAAMGLFNLAYAYGELSRPGDEIAAYDDFITRFGTSDDPALRERLAKALFKKACALARGGDVAGAIASLRQWAARSDSFDCAAVQGDADFDPVREDPAFIDFMAEMGCAAPAPSPEEPPPAA